MKITTVYKDEEDAPITGLTPKISITDVTNIGTPVVELTSGSMTDITLGFYAYDFSTYTQGKEYIVYIDADSSISNRYQYSTLDKYNFDN